MKKTQLKISHEDRTRPSGFVLAAEIFLYNWISQNGLDQNCVIFDSLLLRSARISQLAGVVDGHRPWLYVVLVTLTCQLLVAPLTIQTHSISISMLAIENLSILHVCILNTQDHVTGPILGLQNVGLE